MTRYDLFEAMNGLEDRDLLAADQYKKRRLLWAGGAATAACLCLALGLWQPWVQPEYGEPEPAPEYWIPTPEPWPIPGKEPAEGPISGGALPDGMDPATASIVVLPVYRTLHEVDPNHVSLLDPTEEKTYQQEGLSHALPSVLPEGYVFYDSDLYRTTMKDGTVYRMLRVHYQKGEPKIVGSAVIGSNACSTPAYYPADSFTVTVTDFEPNTEKTIYRPDQITKSFLKKNGGSTFHIALEDCWVMISPTSLTNDEVLALVKEIAG